jgi:hypothetical protein
MFCLFVGLFARVASTVLHDWTSERPFSELASAVGVGDSSQGAWNFTSKCVLTDSTFARVLFTTPSPPPAFNVSMRATLDIRFPDPAEHYDGIYVVFGGIAGFHMKNTPGRMDVFMFTSPSITIFDPEDSAGAVENVSNEVMFNETTSNQIRFVVEWLAGNVDFVNVTAFFVSEKAVANATIMSFVQRLPQRAGRAAFVPSVTASPFMLTTRWNARFCMRAWRVETLEILPASTTSSSRFLMTTASTAQTGSTASTSALTSASGSTRSATLTFATSTGATSPPSAPTSTASTAPSATVTSAATSTSAKSPQGAPASTAPTAPTAPTSTLTLPPTVQPTSVSVVATTSSVSGVSATSTDTGAGLVVPEDTASPKEAEFPLGIVIGASVAGGVLLVGVIGALLFCVVRRRTRAGVAAASIKDEQFTSARAAPAMQVESNYAVLPSGGGTTMESAKSEYDSPAGLKLRANHNANYASGQLEADYASARM